MARVRDSLAVQAGRIKQVAGRSDGLKGPSDGAPAGCVLLREVVTVSWDKLASGVSARMSASFTHLALGAAGIVSSCHQRVAFGEAVGALNLGVRKGTGELQRCPSPTVPSWPSCVAVAGPAAGPADAGAEPSFPLLHPLVPTSTPMAVTTGSAEENSWSGGEQAGLVFRVIVACQIVSEIRSRCTEPQFRSRTGWRFENEEAWRSRSSKIPSARESRF